MRRKYLVALTMAGLILASCSRESESVTGTYGQGMLSGQVFLVDSPEGSPAGVEVSVRGTGMTLTLAADGKFVFAGVPENAELDFRRATDGIEASMRLEQSSGFVIVELAQNSATKKSGRRRSAGRSTEKIYEFEGLIRSVAADSIVVFTSKQVEVTIGLTPDTVIRKGRTLLAAGDLLVDMRVHVKARKVGDAYTAAKVIVQEPDDDDDDGEDDGPAVREYEGIVSSAAAGQLVVFTSHKQEVTFILTADTVVRKGNTPVDPATILPGWRVHVKATANADGTNTAVRVTVQNTRVEAEIEGTVASVGTSSLVVTTATGDFTVQVSNSTQIRDSGKKIPLSEVEVGDAVEVEGTLVDATTIQAKKINVED